MQNRFKDAAVANLWCSPEMDKQAVIKPARLSKPSGAIRDIVAIVQSVSLPTIHERFHVYKIGQISPEVYGIETDLSNWVTAVELGNDSAMQVMAYSDTGRTVPKEDMYFRKISSNLVLMAIRDDNSLIEQLDLKQETVYVRFYSNAFHNSVRSASLTEDLHSYSVVVRSPQDVADFTNEYNKYKDLPGFIKVIRNGYLTNLPNVHGVNNGEVLELFYDSAVIGVLEFPISELKSFHSELDNVNKYLIHPKKDAIAVDSIFYKDDIDFFVFNNQTGVDFKGLYLHQNLHDNVRMVTHVDYSLKVSHVHSLTDQLGINYLDGKVIALIRNSGYERKVPYERHLIHELYKLPDDEIVKTMVGIGVPIEYWTAACLEQSYFTKIMRGDLDSITEDNALKAFGYGGSVIQIQDAPVVLDGSFSVDAPVGYTGDVLVMEQDYDAGTFKAYYETGRSTYTGLNVNNGVLDFRLATPGHVGKVYEDIPFFNIDANLGYTALRANKQAGVRVGEWVDVTGSGDYVIENGIFKWLIELPLYSVVVIPGDYSLIRQLEITDPIDFFIDLSIGSEIDGVVVPTAEDIIVVGGRVLTEEIDYIVKDGIVRITNRAVLSMPLPTPVTVIRCGCGNNRSRTDHGYVKYNSLSRNNVYDLHEGTVMHCISDGKIIAKDKLAFAEDENASSFLENGRPYALKYYRGPIHDVPWFKISDLRDDWDNTYEQVSNYLTTLLEEVTYTFPSAIGDMYELYSPFMGSVSRDLSNGQLSVPEGNLTDEQIKTLLDSYVHLLDFEPVLSEHYDSNFVVVTPTRGDDVIQVDNQGYYILTRAIHIWLNGQVELTAHIGIRNE